MIDPNPKCSDKPIFWGLSGVGGVWSAIIVSVMILLVGTPLLLGLFLDDTLSYEHVLVFTQGLIGRILLSLMIALLLWCGSYRVYYAMYDLKVYILAGRWVFCGLAATLTVVTLIGVITV